MRSLSLALNSYGLVAYAGLCEKSAFVLLQVHFVMLDGNDSTLERKNGNENRNAIWRTYN